MAFEASQLIGDADTKDQQRGFACLFVPPNYLNKDAVKEWLLGLKSDGEILGRSDMKLPKGCGDFSGHTHSIVSSRRVSTSSLTLVTLGAPPKSKRISKSSSKRWMSRHLLTI